MLPVCLKINTVIYGLEPVEAYPNMMESLSKIIPWQMGLRLTKYLVWLKTKTKISGSPLPVKGYQDIPENHLRLTKKLRVFQAIISMHFSSKEMEPYGLAATGMGLFNTMENPLQILL